LIYNFILTTFDYQGASQGGDISARAFALARPGVTPPLHGYSVIGIVRVCQLPTNYYKCKNRGTLKLRGRRYNNGIVIIIAGLKTCNPLFD